MHGGSNSLENLVAACQFCNGAKNDMSVEEFREKLRKGFDPKARIRSKRTRDRIAMPSKTNAAIRDAYVNGWGQKKGKTHPEATGEFQKKLEAARRWNRAIEEERFQSEAHWIRVPRSDKRG